VLLLLLLLLFVFRRYFRLESLSLLKAKQMAPPSNRHHQSNDDCLEGKLSGLFCAILCATIVHSAMRTHMNRPNSSLDWVLTHWAHFTVLRFIFVCFMYIIVYCMHV